jgi:peptidoglycan/LPS O-acetylase OafA/YrhL
MNEKTKKILYNVMSAIGLVLLSIQLADSIFFNAFDKWTGSLLSILGVGLILGGWSLRRWKQNMSLVSKTMIILTNILFVAALIMTLFSRHDTFLLDFGRGVMLVAFLTYIILFFRTEYKGE